MKQEDIPLGFIEVKAIAQILHSEFELNKPDHQYTKMMGKLWANLEELDQAVQKLQKESLLLKDRVEKYVAPQEYKGFTEDTEQTDTKKREPLTDEEWLNKPIQTKTPF